MEDLTGERNVVLGCLAMGMTKKEIKAKYEEIVDFSGVGEIINLPMKTYSSGMGSRLRFAIAAAKDHEILLIDEALATGDAEFRVKSHARIDELRKQAGTVFLVAHDLEEVEDTCNRVIWLDRGKIVEQGEDVIGIIDRYIESSGGEKVTRDPVTRKRISAPSPPPPDTPRQSGRRVLSSLGVLGLGSRGRDSIGGILRPLGGVDSFWPLT